MNVMDMLANRVEPLAYAVAKENEANVSTDQVMKISMAESAKRQADALEKIAKVLVDWQRSHWGER